MDNDDKLFFWQAVCEHKYLNNLSFAQAVNEVALTQINEINSYDDLGMTPLHHAIHDALIYHDETGIKALLDLGADVNIPTHSSTSEVAPLNALDFTLIKYDSLLEAVKLGKIKPNYEYQLLQNILSLLKVHHEKAHLNTLVVDNDLATYPQKI
jgi:hypothetical protein